MDKTIIKFKSAVWLKFFIPFGILLFFVAGVSLCYGCYVFGILEREYQQLLFFIPSAIFMFYLCNIGGILFKYRNLKIEILNETIRIINNEKISEYKWIDGLTVKDRNVIKVFEMYDSCGKRLFMIDYEFPKFSLLTTIIHKKIANPNKNLTELITMNNEI